MPALILVALFACSCAGTIHRRNYVERQPDGSWSFTGAPPYTMGDRIAIAANVLCTVLDLASTEVALANGAREGNPFLTERGARIPLMIGSSVGLWALGEWIGWRKSMNGLKAGTACAAAGWNFTL